MPIDPEDVALCVADDGPAGRHGSAPASTPIMQTSLFAFPDFQSLLDVLPARGGRLRDRRERYSATITEVLMPWTIPP